MTNSRAYMRAWRLNNKDKVAGYNAKHYRRFIAAHPGYNAQKIREHRERKR